MAVIDELLVSLGFEYDSKEMDAFKKDLDKSIKAIKKLAKFALAGAAAITALTVASTAASDTQGKLAGKIEESVETIDALQFANRRAGGTADGLANSLLQLASRAGEAARGVGGGVEVFGILDISVQKANGQIKKSSELLLEVSDSLKKFDKLKQIELADKLGLGDTLLLLQQGRSGIQALVAEAKLLGVTTAKDAAISESFQDSLVDIWQITKQISRTLSQTFAPAMEKLNDNFSTWWKRNRELIEQNLPGWIEDATKALKVLAIVLGGVIVAKTIILFGTLIALLKGVTLAALAANVAAALLPILITAGVLAFIGLMEDAKVFFEGGESFIGDMIKRFPDWRVEIEGIATEFKILADLTTAIWDGWKGIFKIFENISVAKLTEVMKNLPGFFIDSAKRGQQQQKGGVDPIIGTIMRGLLLGGFNNPLSPIGAIASNASNTTARTNVEKIDIIVQGGVDTADTIANAVFNVFQQTTQDLNTVVDQ